MSHPHTIPALINVSKLARATLARCPTHAARRDFALSSGLGFATVAQASTGRPLAAEPYLGLCHALALDPVTLDAAADGMPPYGGLVLWRMAGLALAVTREVNRHDARAAAVASKTSLATVSRAESGRALSAAILLRLAAYVGVHPHVWTAPRDAVLGRVAAPCFTGDMA